MSSLTVNEEINMILSFYEDKWPSLVQTKKLRKQSLAIYSLGVIAVFLPIIHSNYHLFS